MRPPATALLSTLAALGLLFACTPRSSATSTLSGGDGPPTVAADGSSTSAASSSTGEGGSTSTGAASAAGTSAASSAATSTGEPVTDVGLPTTGEGGSACNEKIDILFIMGDGYMLEETLDVSTPEFLKTMQEELAEFDLHVMVVDPQGEWGDDIRCPKNKCPADGGCPVEGFEDFPCWALHEEGAITKCDNTRGAGLVFPAGAGAANKPCGVPPGQRYITGDSPDFAEVFSCLSGRSGGSGGQTEHGTTLGRALSYDLQYGCNAGFLRDDALLLVVQVVQMSWELSKPAEWAEYALEAKGYDQDMVVALGIGTEWKDYEPQPLCEAAKSIDEPGGIAEFVEVFDHGVFGSRCAPSYGPFFDGAAAMAAELCRNVPR